MVPFFGSPLTVLLTVLAGLVGVLYWFCTSSYDYWKKKGVPHLPPKPFFGNVMDAILMKKSFNEVHQELYNRFEGHPFAGIYMARTPALLLRDPELIKNVLVRDFAHFHDRGVLIHPDKYPLQQHLFNLPGYRWRVLRNKLSPTFTSGRIKGMFSVIEECSQKLVGCLKETADKGGIVEMKEVLAQFSTDVIGSCAFGLQMNALDDPDSEFRKAGRKIFESSPIKMFALFTNTLIPELGKLLKMDDFSRGMHDFFLKAVKDTVDYRINNNIVRNDFLQLLINLKYKGKVDDSEETEGKPINGTSDKSKDALDFELDDGLMAAQAFVFFLAGFETSSTTMSFAIHEMAMNPDTQAKLREDVDGAIQRNGGTITYEAVMNMKYLDQVVQETLRMYSPVQFLVREVTAPYTMPNTNINVDKGIIAVIPLYALHRDPKYWPNPDRFDPERFTDEEKAKRHHYVHLPFGEGPRNCIGMRFGLLQTKLGLAALISKYEFHVCDKTEMPIQLDPKCIATSTTTGTFVRVTHRNDFVRKRL